MEKQKGRKERMDEEKDGSAWQIRSVSKTGQARSSTVAGWELRRQVSLVGISNSNSFSKLRPFKATLNLFQAGTRRCSMHAFDDVQDPWC